MLLRGPLKVKEICELCEFGDFFLRGKGVALKDSTTFSLPPQAS